jgi:hypothetical protein
MTFSPSFFKIALENVLDSQDQHLPTHFQHSKFTWENLPPRMERKFAISERNDEVSVWI